MRYYLLRADNSWSDLADYAIQPLPRGDGTWVQGEPNGLPSYAPVSLVDQLSAVFDSQTVAIRAQFAPLKAAINLELQQGHLDVVRAIIQGVTVPTELEATRQQLLTLLQ